MKKPKWYEKHREANDQLRALSGAQMGDGLKLLEKLKHGNEVQRELAKVYRHFSADQADALVSLYWQNPFLRALLEQATGKIPEKISEKNPKK